MRRIPDAVRGTGFLIGAWLVLTPTLHPWYVCWMLPFVALFPSAPWIWLAFAAPLLYWPLGRWQSEGIWTEPGWLWPAVALSLAVFGFNMLGDALRDLLDPRLKGS